MVSFPTKGRKLPLPCSSHQNLSYSMQQPESPWLHRLPNSIAPNTWGELTLPFTELFRNSTQSNRHHQSHNLPNTCEEQTILLSYPNWPNKSTEGPSLEKDIYKMPTVMVSLNTRAFFSCNQCSALSSISSSNNSFLITTDHIYHTMYRQHIPHSISLSKIAGSARTCHIIYMLLTHMQSLYLVKYSACPVIQFIMHNISIIHHI